MPRARVWPFTGFQNCAASILARVEFNGANITQAGLSDVSYLVTQFNNTEPQVIIPKASLVIAQVVSDADPITGLLPGANASDGRWTEDNIGFNLAYDVPPAAFPEADEYWVCFIFTPTSGTPFIVLCRGTIISNVGAI